MCTRISDIRAKDLLAWLFVSLIVAIATCASLSADIRSNACLEEKVLESNDGLDLPTVHIAVAPSFEFDISLVPSLDVPVHLGVNGYTQVVSCNYLRGPPCV